MPPYLAVISFKTVQGIFVFVFAKSLKCVRASKTLGEKFISETNQANFQMRIEVYYKLTCITSLRLDSNIYSMIAIILRLIQSIF